MVGLLLVNSKAEVIEFITNKQPGECSLAVIIFSDPRAAKD